MRAGRTAGWIARMLRAVCLTALVVLLPTAAASAIDLPRQYDATLRVVGGYTITHDVDVVPDDYRCAPQFACPHRGDRPGGRRGCGPARPRR